MKRITAMLLSLLLGAGLLTVCWRGTEYHREDTERENGVTLYVRRDRQAAFAGSLTWDGQSDTVDYVIPDRVDGAPDTALGRQQNGTAIISLPSAGGRARPRPAAPPARRSAAISRPPRALGRCRANPCR